MIEVMRFPLPEKRVPSLLHPSFAGRSLAERMRSTTFALFGLAAAAGLALVAIFAQPGGPLLSPAPLPSEPSSSVGKAQALSASAAPTQARHSVILHRSVASFTSGSHGLQAGAAGGGSGNTPASGKVGAPQSVGPQPAGGGGTVESGGGQPETAAPQPTPAPAPEAAPAPESVPVSSPAPAPEKTPTVHIALPGHSSSGHSAGKEIATTVHAIVPPPPASSPPVVVPPIVPGPSASPGDNGHGHGHGHDK
jgi:hypothetical protein